MAGSAPRGVTYIGSTNDLVRRYFEHSQLLGDNRGAKKLKACTNLEPVLAVSGFGCESLVRSFEVAWAKAARVRAKAFDDACKARGEPPLHIQRLRPGSIVQMLRKLVVTFAHVRQREIAKDLTVHWLWDNAAETRLFAKLEVLRDRKAAPAAAPRPRKRRRVTKQVTKRAATKRVQQLEAATSHGAATS